MAPIISLMQEWGYLWSSVVRQLMIIFIIDLSVIQFYKKSENCKKKDPKDLDDVLKCPDK